VVYHYCWTHARDAGFCHGCGGFFGGVESFEVNSLGLCAACFDSLEDEVGEKQNDEDNEATNPLPFLAFDAIGLPRVDDPEHGLRATFERVAAAHPHKTIKCPYCHAESFIAHLSDDNHLALYCDACDEQVLVCQASDIKEWDLLKLQKKERAN
jgi:hypothetical protein